MLQGIGKKTRWQGRGNVRFIRRATEETTSQSRRVAFARPSVACRESARAAASRINGRKTGRWIGHEITGGWRRRLPSRAPTDRAAHRSCGDPAFCLAPRTELHSVLFSRGGGMYNARDANPEPAMRPLWHDSPPSAGSRPDDPDPAESRRRVRPRNWVDNEDALKDFRRQSAKNSADRLPAARDGVLVDKNALSELPQLSESRQFPILLDLSARACVASWYRRTVVSSLRVPTQFRWRFSFARRVEGWVACVHIWNERWHVPKGRIWVLTRVGSIKPWIMRYGKSRNSDPTRKDAPGALRGL